MLWHQSLKSIHYRILSIFQNKKNNRFEGQNMGGIKDMLSPPHVKTWGDISPPPPLGFTPLLPDVRYTSVMYGYKACDINSKVILQEILLIDSVST